MEYPSETPPPLRFVDDEAPKDLTPATFDDEHWSAQVLGFLGLMYGNSQLAAYAHPAEVITSNPSPENPMNLLSQPAPLSESVPDQPPASVGPSSIPSGSVDGPLTDTLGGE